VTTTNAYVFGFLTCALLVLLVHVWRHWSYYWSTSCVTPACSFACSVARLQREASLLDATEERREELERRWVELIRG
jgi:hypothetical protein